MCMAELFPLRFTFGKPIRTRGIHLRHVMLFVISDQVMEKCLIYYEFRISYLDVGVEVLSAEGKCVVCTIKIPALKVIHKRQHNARALNSHLI